MNASTPRRLALTSVLALALSSMLALAAPARAQSASDPAIAQKITNDLTTLSVNLPVWLAEHLPAVMAPVGLGAGSGISDDSGGFTLGIVTRVGLFNNFDDTGYGLQLVDIQSELPSLVPWPQFGVVAGLTLGHGFELGADVQFIPNMDIAADDMDLNVGLLGIGVTARVRVNKADGIVPALVIGLGASYYGGTLTVGEGYGASYTQDVDGKIVTGHYKLDTAPNIGWSLFQFDPEIRLAWDVAGVFRPYLGIGLGLTFGSVDDHVHVHAVASVDTIDGNPQTGDVVNVDQEIAHFSTEPALYTLRPHVGFDILLGPVAITAQVDLAVMGKDKIDSNLGEAASSFDSSDGHYLFNQNARNTQTQSALVGTLALRLQF